MKTTSSVVTRFFTFLLLTTFFYSNVSAFQSKRTIHVFSPGVESNQFWSEMIGFGKSVSDKLGLDLVVHYGDDSPDKLLTLMEKVAMNAVKPDGFIFPSMLGQGERFIKIAEKYKIPSIVVNMGLNDSKVIKSTRLISPYFIGQVTADDESAGYEQAKTLIGLAKQQGFKQPINLVALAGRKTDIASIDRVKGLERALKEHSDITLTEIIHTDWSVSQTQLALNKFALEKTSIIWTASDLMGLTVSEYVAKNGIKQGKDILIGGIDWTQKGLESVKNGGLSTTVGGHFAEVGWAVILFYDYFNGKDFSSETTVFKSVMKPLTAQNVQMVLSGTGAQRWDDVNFKAFSKVLNPSLKAYKFDLVVLLRMAKN